MRELESKGMLVDRDRADYRGLDPLNLLQLNRISLTKIVRTSPKININSGNRMILLFGQ